MGKLDRGTSRGGLWCYVLLPFFIMLPLGYMISPWIFGALYLGVCVFLTYRTGISHATSFLFLVAFFSRLVVVLMVQTPPESDFDVLYQASLGVCNGDRSFVDAGYFLRWPYQSGFVYFQSLLLEIWNSLFFLKLVNCFTAAATVVLVYWIAREFCSDRAALLGAVLYSFLPYPLFYVTVLTNQFMASFLLYLGLYLLIRKKSRLCSHIRYLIFGVLLGVANILRPESIIPLTAVGLYLLVSMRRSNFRENLLNLGILFGTYLLLSRGASFLFSATGLSPQGLSNNDPLWKFVLGFNHESGGRYATADEPFLGNRAMELELIRQRILVPLPKLLKLMKAKIVCFWGEYPLSWTFNYAMETGISVFGRIISVADDVGRLHLFTKCVMIAMYACGGLGTILYMRKKDRALKLLPVFNQAFVTFGVYLLIEVQSRYSYYVIPFIFILAALCFSWAEEKGKQRRMNREIRKEV